MEKLTINNGIGYPIELYCGYENCDTREEECPACISQSVACGALHNALKRLAAYEGTNLTPEQIKEIDKLYLEKCQEVNQLKEQLKTKETVNQLYQTTTSMIGSEKDCLIKELRYYRQLKEQGRLIELPCNIGDTVYFIKSVFSYSKEPMEKEVSSVHIHRSCTMIDCGDRRFDPDYIGKTVFLTREEAEKALAERQVSE